MPRFFLIYSLILSLGETCHLVINEIGSVTPMMTLVDKEYHEQFVELAFKSCFQKQMNFEDRHLVEIALRPVYAEGALPLLHYSLQHQKLRQYKREGERISIKTRSLGKKSPFFVIGNEWSATGWKYKEPCLDCPFDDILYEEKTSSPRFIPNESWSKLKASVSNVYRRNVDLNHYPKAFVLVKVNTPAFSDWIRDQFSVYRSYQTNKLPLFFDLKNTSSQWEEFMESIEDVVVLAAHPEVLRGLSFLRRLLSQNFMEKSGLTRLPIIKLPENTNGKGFLYPMKSLSRCESGVWRQGTPTPHADNYCDTKSTLKMEQFFLGRKSIIPESDALMSTTALSFDDAIRMQNEAEEAKEEANIQTKVFDTRITEKEEQVAEEQEGTEGEESGEVPPC